MTKTCEECGKAFTRPPSQSKQRFCSKDCATANQQKNRIHATCANCGTTYPRKSNGAIPKYCSETCRVAFREKKRTQTCSGCGATYIRPTGRAVGLYCSPECYRKFGTTGIRVERVEHRMRSARGHPIAPPSGIVAIARLNLYDKIGAGPHPCHWCGDPIDWKPGGGLKDGALLADHLDWDRTNDDPANLVPSCNVCNSHRTRTGDRRRIQPDELTVSTGKGRTRAVRCVCESCWWPFVVRLTDVKKGGGRFCSLSCARRGPRPKPDLVE